MSTNTKQRKQNLVISMYISKILIGMFFLQLLFVIPALGQECIPNLISQTSNDNFAPKISGNNIVWRGYDGISTHIYLYDGANVMKASVEDSNTSVNNDRPQIAGNNIDPIGSVKNTAL